MLFTNCFTYRIFYHSCWYITLVGFLFSTTNTSAYEELTCSKNIIDVLNPEKKIKKLNKYIKRLEKFSKESSFKDLSKYICSLKKFAEKEIGREITLEDLNFEVNKKLNEFNLSVNPSIVKSYLTNLLKKEKRKAITPQEEEFIGNPQIALGCVFLASAILIGAIGFAVPPLAPFCTATAQTVAGVGIGFIGNGLLQGEGKRKNLAMSI